MVGPLLHSDGPSNEQGIESGGLLPGPDEANGAGRGGGPHGAGGTGPHCIGGTRGFGNN